jgi:hypothetical protein
MVSRRVAQLAHWSLICDLSVVVEAIAPALQKANE